MESIGMQRGTIALPQVLWAPRGMVGAKVWVNGPVLHAGLE